MPILLFPWKVANAGSNRLLFAFELYFSFVHWKHIAAWRQILSQVLERKTSFVPLCVCIFNLLNCLKSRFKKWTSETCPLLAASRQDGFSAIDEYGWNTHVHPLSVNQWCSEQVILDIELNPFCTIKGTSAHSGKSVHECDLRVSQ